MCVGGEGNGCGCCSGGEGGGKAGIITSLCVNVLTFSAVISAGGSFPSRNKQIAHRSHAGWKVVKRTHDGLLVSTPPLAAH